MLEEILETPEATPTATPVVITPTPTVVLTPRPTPLPVIEVVTPAPPTPTPVPTATPTAVPTVTPTATPVIGPVQLTVTPSPKVIQIAPPSKVLTPLNIKDLGSAIVLPPPTITPLERSEGGTDYMMSGFGEKESAALYGISLLFIAIGLFLLIKPIMHRWRNGSRASLRN